MAFSNKSLIKKNPINWNSLPNGTLSLNDYNLLDDSFVDKNYVRKYTMFETTEDVLALSCAWYRLRKEHKLNGKSYSHISSVLDKIVLDNLVEEDRIMSNKVRDYYGKKLMVMILKEKPLTNFRKDLNKFLASDSKNVDETMLPLVASLPKFYDYDIEFDKMVKEISEKKSLNIIKNTRANEVLSLIPLKSFEKKKSVEYWFRDSDYNLLSFTIDKTNGLLSLWDREYKDNKHIILNAKIDTRVRDDIVYYELSKYKFC